MAIRGRAEPNYHNPTLYIYSVILESTKGIEMKLGL